MSYTRRFSKSVKINYSGSVSYPASQNGGSVSYSGTAIETVHIDVTVDTDPFDSAVYDMKGGIDLLTDSVVATEAAQLESIDSSSRKIGDTIISGFFKTVKSDISQQIAQLKIRSESLLLQLSKLATRCREKQKQMGVDYQRISDRYVKIFTDLNKELENRVYSIDEPVFRTSRLLDKIGRHEGNEDASATVSVTAGETAHVHSMLTVNLAKRRAKQALEKAERFLKIQYSTDDVIKSGLLSKGVAGFIYSPFSVIEMTSENGLTNRELFSSPLLKGVQEDVLYRSIDGKGWSRNIPVDDVRQIRDYFNSEVAQLYDGSSNKHEHRVAHMMTRLFNLSHTATPDK